MGLIISWNIWLDLDRIDVIVSLINQPDIC